MLETYLLNHFLLAIEIILGLVALTTIIVCGSSVVQIAEAGVLISCFNLLCAIHTFALVIGGNRK